MAKYRRKPNVVDAFKWTGDVEQTEDPEWLVEKMDSGEVIVCSETIGFHDNSEGITEIWLEIETLEGTMRANQGDYVVKGIKGEIYPCKPDIFEANHEIIEEDNDRKGKVINIVDTRDRLIASISEEFIILDNNYRVIKTNEDDACFANENDEMFVLRPD